MRFKAKLLKTAYETWVEELLDACRSVFPEGRTSMEYGGSSISFHLRKEFSSPYVLINRYFYGDIPPVSVLFPNKLPKDKVEELLDSLVASDLRIRQELPDIITMDFID